MFFLAFITAFIAAFTQTLAVLVDNVIVCAFYGESEIAAVTLAGPFFYLLEIPAAGLGAGIQTVCAKELGAGNVDGVNRKFSQIFFMSGFVLVILTALSFLCVPRMAVLFGARGQTAGLLPYAADYLYGLSAEILPYVMFCIMTPVIIMDNGGKLITAASVCGCLADIIIDLVSVRLGWGLRGIGAATSISAAIYFLVTLLHFLKKDRVIRLRPVRIRFGELKNIFISSAPKALLSLADAIRSAVFISIVSAAGGIIGTCVLSIHGTINYTISIFTTGLSGAVGILAGISFGEKNKEELEGVGVMAHRYSLFISAGILAVLGACAYPLAALLTENRATEELLIFAIYCVIASAPLSLLVRARVGYLQVVEKVTAAQWVGAASNLVFLVAGACLLTPVFGVKGVFLGFPVSQLATLTVIWLSHMKRIKKIIPSGSDYLEIDKSFDISPADVISYPVSKIEDCVLASEQVVLFCRGHKLDERKGMLAGLCTEELTTNVFRHGIRPRQVIRNADIRIVIDDQDVIIRVRDGGAAFNLKRFADRLSGEDDALSGTGIKILLNAAKDISYYRTYGMNTTIVRV